MAFYLYRVNGGEVTVMSVSVDGFGTPPPIFAIASNPANTPDGEALVPPKIYIPGTDTLRNADAGEITAFGVAEAADDNLAQRESAKQLFLNPTQRKFFKSFTEILIGEINTLRALHSLPDRTLGQLITAIDNKIDSGDND